MAYGEDDEEGTGMIPIMFEESPEPSLGEWAPSPHTVSPCGQYNDELT